MVDPDRFDRGWRRYRSRGHLAHRVELVKARGATEAPAARADKRDDLRAQLYLDLMEYLENLDNRLMVEQLEIPQHLDQMPSPPHKGQLSARVLLYCDAELVEAWNGVLAANHGVTNGQEEGQPAPALWDEFRTVRAAVGELQSLLRDRVTASSWLARISGYT